MYMYTYCSTYTAVIVIGHKITEIKVQNEKEEEEEEEA
jgi:hypothetical protein